MGQFPYSAASKIETLISDHSRVESEFADIRQVYGGGEESTETSEWFFRTIHDLMAKLVAAGEELKRREEAEV